MEIKKFYSSEQARLSKDASKKDGMLASAMSGFGESFVVPFALFVGAEGGIIGVLQSFPRFLGSLAQFLLLPLSTSLKERKSFVILFVLLQACIWALFALLAFLAFPAHIAIFAIFVLFSLNFMFGMGANPPWASWMAEIVEKGERGSYFAKRNQLAMVALLFATVSGGWLLDHFNASLSSAFAILFALAFAARFFGASFIKKMHEIPPQDEIGIKIRPAQILTNPALKDEKSFAFYAFFFIGATYIASPFFDVYMLTTLQFSYLTWSIIKLAAPVAKPITLPYWGKVIDRFGNRAVLYATGILIPAVPLFWLLSPDPLYLVIIELFSGILWGGFELSAFNHTISSKTPSIRTIFSAAYNLATGSGALVGGLLGGILFFLWPEGGIISLGACLGLFAISGILRVAANLHFLPILWAKSNIGMPSEKFLWQVMLTQPSREVRHVALVFASSGMHTASNGACTCTKIMRIGMEKTICLICGKKKK